MAENPSKFDQIRKLREAHIERVETERVADTKRKGKAQDQSHDGSKADHETDGAKIHSTGETHVKRQ